MKRFWAVVPFFAKARAAAMAAIAMMMTACVPLSGGWSVDDLYQHHPQVSSWPGQRLGDTPPYFTPRGESMILFLCRFSKRAPISVSLPSSASSMELVAMRMALEAWGNAELGIRLEEVAAGSAMIEIDFAKPRADSSRAVTRSVGTGYTVSDCALAPDGGISDGLDGSSGAGGAGERVAGELVRASITLRRSNMDMLGHEVALDADELVGTVLHELGHALGFAGHVATPDSVMSKSTDTVRRFGRRLRAGQGFASASLAALYALPAGTVVGRVQSTPAAQILFEAAVGFARNRAWQGPFVRVGDRGASVSWRNRGARVGVLELHGYREALRTGSLLFFSTSPFERVLRRSEKPVP